MLKVAKKYILAFPKKSRNEVSSAIAEAGCFEIIENKESIQEETVLNGLQSAEYKLATMDFAISYLEPFSKKPSFFLKIKNPKIPISANSLRQIDQEKAFQTVKRIEKIEKKLDILKKQEKDIQNNFLELEKFNGLSFLPQDTELAFFLVGAISRTGKEKFKNFIKENNLFQKHLSVLLSKDIYLIVGLKENREKAINGLKAIKGEIIPYGFEQSPVQERIILQNKAEETSKGIEALNQELAVMAKDIEKLKIYRDILESEKINWEIKNKTLILGLLDYVVFWGYEREAKKLNEQVSPACQDVFLKEIAIEKGEEPRVILENHKLIRPFQYVTEIFGMPKPGEVDPTP
ncbi:MAG: hypothetical protein PHW31_02145 [Candidatus Pacebacteria bacterium]|nr:hypothetical protein [Candidatus Paceibacterota bacterium]